MRAPSVSVQKVKHINKLCEQVVGELPVPGGPIYEVKGPCVPIEVIVLADKSETTKGELAAKALMETLEALCPKPKPEPKAKGKKEKK